MTALFLYTLEMKERFWKFWFYLMWALYTLGISGIIYGWYMKYNAEDLQQVLNDYQGLIEFYIWFTVLTFIPMTIIRWMATGKHFWNKP